MRIIRRLRELEGATAPLPQTLPEALRLAADMAEQNAQLTSKIHEDAPKVAFVEHYVETGGAKGLRETAKILNMPEKAMIDALVRDTRCYSAIRQPVARCTSPARRFVYCENWYL